MFKSYLTIIWRNLYRQPVYTVLNLFCLSIGIAAALLILLYLNFELNYDLFNQKADRIFRVETTAIKTHEKIIDVEWSSTPALLVPYVQQDYPEVEAATRIYVFFRNEVVELSTNGKITEASDIAVVDSTMLDIFTFDFIHGDPNTALDGPDKIILSASLSEQIFGLNNPVGKIIKSNLVHILPDVDPNYSFMVTGVYQDLPANSHLSLNALISAASDPKLEEYYFKRFSYYSYVLLNDQIDPSILAQKFGNVYKQYLDPKIEPVMKEAVHELVALPEIHMREAGGYTYIYIFASVAFLLLLISIISYVNLVTAQANKRSKEIGVRKVMGSNRQQLILQFLLESLFFSGIALGFAVLIVVLAITPLNEILNLQLSTQQLWQVPLLTGMFGLFLLVGLLGGSYPAFFLSSFQPLSVIKGQKTHGIPLRKALVAIQFTVVIFVLVSTGMIQDQLQYLSQKDLGFNQHQVVQLNFPSEEGLQKSVALKEIMKQSPLVKAIGTSSFLPGLGMPRRPISADGSADQESQFVHFGGIDYDYLETMDITILEGRNFSLDHPSDLENHVLVNESFAQSFGLDNPVGEKIRYGDKGNPNFKQIIGVVKDFHQNTLHNPIAAQIFLLEPTSYNIAVKLDQDITLGMDHIEKSWNQVFPNAPFEYRFLNDELIVGYELDQIRGNIFLLFSIITIIISFLSLFGLAAFITKQRVKEISIRQIVGASLSDIVLLISKDFLLLVSFSALPAFVLAWYFINQWLQEFAYQTTMNYMIFGLVLLFTLLLTLVTTGLHAAQATRLNPTQTLKHE